MSCVIAIHLIKEQITILKPRSVYWHQKTTFFETLVIRTDKFIGCCDTRYDDIRLADELAYIIIIPEFNIGICKSLDKEICLIFVFQETNFTPPSSFAYRAS